MASLPIKLQESISGIYTKVNHILEMNGEENITAQLINEIDQVVYNLYDLTDVEIKIIEGEN